MERRLSLAILIIACALPFLRIGIGEIQPWDESLYVVRAQACLQFGAWLDQTPYAIGHLYSATHPPFGIWLIAISKLIFGSGTSAVRFPIALLSSAGIFVFWLLLRKFTSGTAALIGAVSVASSDLFLALSHRAQMEMPVFALGIASIYFLILSIERDRLWLSLLAGSMLGLGLLTKFGFALFVVPFLLLLPWIFPKKNAYLYVGLAVVLGVAIAAPWFLMMSANHPDYWPHVLGSLTILEEGAYAPSHLAWWYYFNRLFVALPLIVVVIAMRDKGRALVASVVWLLLLLAGLQLIGTKMAHFAFVLLAPGGMIVALGWEHLMERPKPWRAAVLVLLGIAFAWSISEQVRLLATGRLRWNATAVLPETIIVLVITIIATSLILFKASVQTRYALGFCVLLLGVAIGHLISQQDAVFMLGARRTAAVAFSVPQKNTIVLIHPDFPNEEYAPQLAYYTDGWTLGWLPGKYSNAITWQRAAGSSYVPDPSTEIAIVSHFEDRFNPRSLETETLWNELIGKLRQKFSQEKDFRCYTVFY